MYFKITVDNWDDRGAFTYILRHETWTDKNSLILLCVELWYERFSDNKTWEYAIEPIVNTLADEFGFEIVDTKDEVQFDAEQTLEEVLEMFHE